MLRPRGCVNIHGHLHGTAARIAARRSSRHLNVNVELVNYRPVRLAEFAATARRLLSGDIQPQLATARTIAAARKLAERQAAAERAVAAADPSRRSIGATRKVDGER